VAAIVLSDLSEERRHNLRFAFRVRPPADFDLTMYNSHKEDIKVVDISAIGVRFSHDLVREYKVGQEIKMYLGYEQAFYELKAQVVRKETGIGEGRNEIEYVAVQFLDIDYRIEEELFKIVRRIEFQQTSNRLFK
ncbi:MAG: PilZ domain-containing protein, partial [Deltaproteobacteria bacterium]|nr:PilZ domain-containing protein [Deltaproteobacteria bacterium]